MLMKTTLRPLLAASSFLLPPYSLLPSPASSSFSLPSVPYFPLPSSLLFFLFPPFPTSFPLPCGVLGFKIFSGFSQRNSCLTRFKFCLSGRRQTKHVGKRVRVRVRACACVHARFCGHRRDWLWSSCLENKVLKGRLLSPSGASD